MDAAPPTNDPYSPLLGPLPLPIAVVDSAGRFVFVNDAFRRRVDVAAITPVVTQAFDQRGPPPRQIQFSAQAGGQSAWLVFSVQAASPATWILFEDQGEAFEALQLRLAELERISTTDTLTGAWNRYQLDRLVGSEMARAQRYRQPLSILMIDVDHFKRVNDKYGHAVGDQVLRAVVERTRSCLRIADVLCRWGGEEFVILAPGTTFEGAESLAERIRAALAAQPIDPVAVVTVSIGVAEYMHKETRGDWFERADQAVYQAKSHGRNQVVVDVQGASLQWAEQDAFGGVLGLVWRDSYESGFAPIDDEHRELFRLANRTIARLFESRPDMYALQAEVTELVQHIQDHFKHEEAVLSEIGFPGLEGHRRAHEHLLGRARELKEAASNGSVMLGELVQFLAQEVVSRHILAVDRQFYPLLLGHPQ